MYVPDTLRRLNDEAVERELSKKVTCDYCNKKAKFHIPLYNPADAVRRPPVEGAYGTVHVCQDHSDDATYLEENYYCDDCGDLFIRNHSWDSLQIIIDGNEYCHKCALKHIEPELWSDVKSELMRKRTKLWHRHNGIPDREPVWEGEYSDFSDFPGHTSFNSIIREVEEAGVKDDDKVFVFVTMTYQFSVVLGIWRAE